ncbi:MAG: hypothetical protein QXD48_00170 [Candidatus Aenigmatarchaeota archaeon]
MQIKKLVLPLVFSTLISCQPSKNYIGLVDMNKDGKYELIYFTKNEIIDEKGNRLIDPKINNYEIKRIEKVELIDIDKDGDKDIMLYSELKNLKTNENIYGILSGQNNNGNFDLKVLSTSFFKKW